MDKVADLMFGVEVDLGFTDKRRSASQSDQTPLGTAANYASGNSLDARLTAISSTSYSAARLRQMNINDKVYAVRLNDDLAGI
jgi:hypothetical protein